MNVCKLLSISVTTSVLCLPCCADISRLKTLKGLALQDIVTQIHTYIHRGMYT